MPSIWGLGMNAWDSEFITESSLEKKLELESLADTLLEDKIDELKPTSDSGLLIEILMKIPFIAALLNRIKVTGVSVFSLATFRGQLNEVTLPSFLCDKPLLVAVYKNLGLIAAITDFLSIPLVYLASIFLRKPYPLTLTKFGEWLYSGLLLALTFTSIILPFTAPIIAGILCSLGLLYSSYLLYQFYEQRKELNTIIPITQDKIEFFKNKIEESKNEIRILKKNIMDASTDALNDIEIKLKQYQIALDNDYPELTTLVHEVNKLEEELKALNEVVIYDKILSFTLSSITMMGFTIGFFNPVIGFIMLTSVAVIGSIYALGRIALPFFNTIGKSITEISLDNTEHSDLDDDSSSKEILDKLKNQLSDTEKSTKKEENQEDLKSYSKNQSFFPIKKNTLDGNAPSSTHQNKINTL